MYLITPEYNTQALTTALNSFMPQWLQLHKRDVAAQFCHYTTVSGLQGILRDRCLWMGHVSTFNDPNEIQYGQRLASDMLNGTMQSVTSPKTREFLNHLLTQVYILGKSHYQVFVTCFCESDNLLSQWRAYTDKGIGYCLTFVFTEQTRLGASAMSQDEGPGFFLRRIIYKPEEQRDLVRRYLQVTVEAVEKALLVQHDIEPVVMAVEACNVLLDMLVCFKHPAFEEENEWRLVRVTLPEHESEQIGFRERNGLLIPYRPTYIYDAVDVNKRCFPLRTITLGPSMESVRAQSAIGLFLKHLAARDHPIELPTDQIEIREAGYGLNTSC